MNKLFRNFDLHIHNKKAQGVVEFALILPVLLLLIVGIFSLGHLFFIHIMISSASSEAVRYGMASGKTSAGVIRYLDCQGMRDAAVRIGGSVGVQNANVSITYDSGPGTSVKSTCPTSGNFASGSEPDIDLGDRVVVRVQITYKPYFPIVSLPTFPVTSSAARTIVTSVNVGATSDATAIPTVECTENPLPAPVICDGSGTISRDIFLNITGDQVSDLTNSPAYIADAPTSSDTLTAIDVAQSYPNTDNYGTRIRGYLCPPYSGDYTFHMSANNAAILYLSGDASVGGKSAIITSSDWAPLYHEWNFSSSTVTLEAGVKYYIEVLHKEEAQVDFVSIGWTGPGFDDITVINGLYLLPYVP